METETETTVAPEVAAEASKEINVVFEEPTVEPEVVQEETPVVTEEPVAEEVDEIAVLKKELEESKSAYSDLKGQTNLPEAPQSLAEQYTPPVQPQIEEVDYSKLDFGDPISDPEGFNKNLMAHMQEREAAVIKQTQDAVFDSDRMRSLEQSHWTREHELAVEKANNKFGEAFDYSVQGTKLSAMQQKLPGLAIEDAHRVNDYDRVFNELKNLKEGEMERKNTQTPPAAAPTRMLDTNTGTTVKLTAAEKAVCDKLGTPYEKYAKGKLRAQGKLDD